MRHSALHKEDLDTGERPKVLGSGWRGVPHQPGVI
jgi:hypothetical protein